MSDLISSTFVTVGGRVYSDLLAQVGLQDLVVVANAWRATHAQTYGAVIPNSGTAYFHNSSDPAPAILVGASDNEVIQVNAISVENAGSGSIAYKFAIGDTTFNVGTIASGADSVNVLGSKMPLMISKGQDLSIEVTSGTPEDLIVNASGVKTCQ